jgi:hypothetical protein
MYSMLLWPVYNSVHINGGNWTVKVCMAKEKENHGGHRKIWSGTPPPPPIPGSGETRVLKGHSPKAIFVYKFNLRLQLNREAKIKERTRERKGDLGQKSINWQRLHSLRGAMKTNSHAIPDIPLILHVTVIDDRSHRHLPYIWRWPVNKWVLKRDLIARDRYRRTARRWSLPARGLSLRDRSASGSSTRSRDSKHLSSLDFTKHLQEHMTSCAPQIFYTQAEQWHTGVPIRRG